MEDLACTDANASPSDVQRRQPTVQTSLPHAQLNYSRLQAIPDWEPGGPRGNIQHSTHGCKPYRIGNPVDHAATVNIKSQPTQAPTSSTYHTVQGQALLRIPVAHRRATGDRVSHPSKGGGQQQGHTYPPEYLTNKGAKNSLEEENNRTGVWNRGNRQRGSRARVCWTYRSGNPVDPRGITMSPRVNKSKTSARLTHTIWYRADDQQLVP